MSGKSGQRETGNKPSTTRRQDSLTPGAFGHESIDNVKSTIQLNRKLAGQPSQQHSKYKKADKTGATAPKAAAKKS